MYTSKSNSAMYPKTINGLMENAIHLGLPRLFSEEFWKDSTTNVPVNIQETENSYVLFVVAPGLKKENFKINLEKNILSISYEIKAEEGSEEKWLRKEYNLTQFKRIFSLNEKMDSSSIKAQYQDGILNVTILKKEIQQPIIQEIEIL